MGKMYYITEEDKSLNIELRVSALERKVSQSRWLTLILELSVLMLGIALVVSKL